MHVLISEVKHSAFALSPITDCRKIIHNLVVGIHNNSDMTMTITVSSRRKKTDGLFKLYYELLYIIFLVLGAFPHINTIIIDNDKLNLDDLAGMYISESEYYKAPYRLDTIKDEHFTQHIIDALRNMRRDALLSFAYIKSKEYVSVIANHKTTLLFHVLEGISILSNQEINQTKRELIQKFPTLANQKPGDYMAIVYDLTKKYFYRYHKKYNCEILQQLHCTQKSFLQTISDTRNQYSHLRFNKEQSLTDGCIMRYYNEIVSLVIRLCILERLSIAVNEDIIKEFLYTIHDWIVETKDGECIAPKSVNYQRISALRVLQNVINNFSIEHEGE